MNRLSTRFFQASQRFGRLPHLPQKPLDILRNSPAFRGDFAQSFELFSKHTLQRRQRIAKLPERRIGPFRKLLQNLGLLDLALQNCPDSLADIEEGNRHGPEQFGFSVG